MRNVFLSFLGLGNTNPGQAPKGYRPAVYDLNGQISSETQFVQVAEMELLDGAIFDMVFIVATLASFDAHYASLKEQMLPFNASPEPLILDEDFSPAGQWKWFETILGVIERGDRLTVDLTHGYRAVPIIFSAALNFLQKARDVEIKAVYYGAYDSNRKLSPIVDMKDFYLINEWADAVSRLVEDADARKLARVAEKTASFQAGELNDTAVIQAFETLTNTIRNVDIHRVGEQADVAIKLVKKKRTGASATGRILLDLVMGKFVSIASGEPASGQYDNAYFRLQMEIIRLLLEHRLYMQAYTVMREFIASIGLIEMEKATVQNKVGRRQRLRFGEPFVNMLQFEEAKWKFGEKAASEQEREIKETDKDWEKLLPFYRKLEAIQIVEILRSFVKELVDYRNGFDHAWTLKASASEDIETKGRYFLEQLKNTVDRLQMAGIL